MSFASEAKHRDISGTNRVVYGEFSQVSGDTGGVVVTGLYDIKYFELMGALNMSVSGGEVTVTLADPGGAQAGFWMAVGL